MTLIAQLTGGDLPFPKDTAPMPWWLTGLLFAAMVAANIYVLVKVRGADARKINAETDVRLEAAQHEGRMAERRQTELEWQKLLEELKERIRELQAETKELRKAHARDLVRVDRELRTAHDQIADLERREASCQEVIQNLKERLDECEQRTPPPG